MDTHQLMEHARTIADAAVNDSSVMRADADIIIHLLDNCDIVYDDDTVFFGNISGVGVANRIAGIRIGRFDSHVYHDALRRGTAVRAFSGSSDFGHTAPLWDDILSLGLRGLRDRVVSLADASSNPDFVTAETEVYDAATRFVLRAGQVADPAA